MNRERNEAERSAAARWPHPLANLSLRTKLLLFALALVTLPGLVFALVAFSGTRAAMEREVGIQLQQSAERGADAVGATLARALSDTRSWARQDIMRDLLVGDIDKRVSRFLQAVRENDPTYLEVVAVAADGNVIAASSGERLGSNIHLWASWPIDSRAPEGFVGPTRSPIADRTVLEIAVPIADPDSPQRTIATLILVYDWTHIDDLLDEIRLKLAPLGKRVASIVVDSSDRVIGGVFFDGTPARPSLPGDTNLVIPRPSGYGAQQMRLSTSAEQVLVGAARVPASAQSFSVAFIERATDALAAVRGVRDRWLFMLAAILLVGLGVATLLARQFMRPLDEVTRTTAYIAAHPDLDLPPLEVHSQDEVGQLTESFNKMTAELRKSQEETLSAAKFAFAGQLAAMVAHEVRTPLTVMRSSAQLLAGSSHDGSDNPELVDTIVSEVDRVERVVNGLIQLARPLEQKPEPTDLAELLARAANFTAAEAERKELHLIQELSPDTPLAYCDSDQIYQVVLNLLVNAIQVLEPGGSIWLRTRSSGRDTTGFEIADDGPGLPSELREQLFQPFVTGREDGTGLGLAFVERVVKAHRGTVSVHSHPGKGTIFAINLPTSEELK